MASADSFQHRARKRFGQNFLQDPHIIRRIVEALHPQPEDSLLEIGPGQGALTSLLLASGAQVQAVELDRDLARYLNAQHHHASNFQLIQGDILKTDIAALHGEAEPPLRVIGNLPYNISTPCIFHLLQAREHIKDMLFMLQREVVERLAAVPGEKSYGRLGIMAQYHCQIEHLFDVPPGAFHPAPKVTSAMVRLIPHASLPHPAEDHQMLQRVVREAFSARRKTLKNGLRSLMKETGVQELPVDTSLRPETLSVADYVRISNVFSLHRSQDHE